MRPVNGVTDRLGVVTAADAPDAPLAAGVRQWFSDLRRRGPRAVCERSTPESANRRCRSTCRARTMQRCSVRRPRPASSGSMLSCGTTWTAFLGRRDVRWRARAGEGRAGGRRASGSGRSWPPGCAKRRCSWTSCCRRPLRRSRRGRRDHSFGSSRGKRNWSKASRPLTHSTSQIRRRAQGTVTFSRPVVRHSRFRPWGSGSTPTCISEIVVSPVRVRDSPSPESLAVVGLSSFGLRSRWRARGWLGASCKQICKQAGRRRRRVACKRQRIHDLVICRTIPTARRIAPAVQVLAPLDAWINVGGST